MRDCIHCTGVGKELIFDWQSAYACSASFTVFLVLTEFVKTETSAPFSQLLTVKTMIREGLDGGSLSGEYSIPLVKFLSNLYDETKTRRSISEMIQAMKLAYNHMVGMRKFDQFNFRASVDYEDGWLNVSCPGNACGLNPEHNAGYDMKRRGLGYKFNCHNIDTPVQQITLLAGLAALHDKARKALKN